jgi:hypothetical protein
MVEGQTDYIVPDDYGSIEQDIEIGDHFIYYTPTQILVQSSHVNGLPSAFTLIDSGHLRFSPAPNADFVAKWPQVMLVYKRRPRLVYLDTDRPDFPMEFQDALKAKGRLRWKAAQEYSQADLQMEEGTYEAMIARKMASYLMTPGKRLGMRNHMAASSRVPFRRF